MQQENIFSYFCARSVNFQMLTRSQCCLDNFSKLTFKINKYNLY